MNILMVISQFHPIVGGAEKQAQLLSKKLSEKGVEVRIVTGWWKWGVPREEIINGIPIFRNFCLWGMFGIKGVRLLGGLAYMLSLAGYLLLHRVEYDIIHVHQVLYPAFMSVFVGKGLLKKRVIAKTGCTGLTSDIKQIKRFPFGNLQLKYLINHLDCLIAINKEGILEFKAAGYPETKIHHIPNGVSLSLPRKTELNRVLCVISAVRLDSQKGIDILLKAWAKVVAQDTTLKLLILGKGHLESKLKKLAKSIGVVNFVEFVGLVGDPENYLKTSDIFVLPSRAEGMSNALLEAMCIGLPCIATNISGNKELISDGEGQSVSEGDFIIGKRGILVNPDNVEGLSEAILYLIRDPGKREELGERAQQFVRRNYSIDLIADKYIELYQRMLGGIS